MNDQPICIIGAGRMGRGIALSYALAGEDVLLVDLKQRTRQESKDLVNSVRSEIGKDLEFLVSANLLPGNKVASILDRVHVIPSADAADGMSAAQIVYEAVPETMQAKSAAFAWISEAVSDQSIVASTTSTLSVEELALLVSRPTRFLNAHWLNPAHLMPLVELSVSAQTSDQTRQILEASLKSIGKVPVVCSASPGYIVPRVQALAMNEAARLVEEGVASAADIDKALTLGFGLRFAVLGVIEFIDWGGNDILYHATNHLSRTVDPDRYSVPEIVEANMREGRNGVREGSGFYDYQDVDVDAYRKQRLQKFVDLLNFLDLLPTGLGRSSMTEEVLQKATVVGSMGNLGR